MKRRFIAPLALAALVLLPGVLSAQTSSLERGQVRSGSLASGDTLHFEFEAGDDFLLYGEVNQISVDVVVRLLNAEGQQFGSWDGPGRGAEAFSSTIREAGTYTLTVRATDEFGRVHHAHRIVEIVGSSAVRE